MPIYYFWMMLSVIVVLLIWLSLSLYRIRLHKRQMTHIQDEQHRELIRIINHHRHDWMNDVQVLFGYIQLNKQEKLKDYIGEISNQITRESLISKLGIPSLVAYMISFRANTSNIVLDIRLEQEISLTHYGEQGERAAQIIMAIIEAYVAAAGSGEGDRNQLSITMSEWEACLLLGFEYDGTTHIDSLKARLSQVIERLCKQPDDQVTMENTEQAIDIEVKVCLTETAR